MQRKREEVIVEANPINLFWYTNRDIRISIDISSCQKNISRRDCVPHYKGYTIEHHVNFVFCGIACPNSYRMLSTVHALTIVFTKRKFGQGTTKMAVGMPIIHAQFSTIFCRIVRNAHGHELLELGVMGTMKGKECTKSCTMNIAHIYDLQNALVKAMGWLSPEQSVMQITIS